MKDCWSKGRTSQSVGYLGASTSWIFPGFWVGHASLEALGLGSPVILLAQWYPLPFFGSGFPYTATNPKQGALIVIWLRGYQVI